MMKSFKVSLLFLSIVHVTQSFAPQTLATKKSSTTSSTSLNALTAADILKRARKSAGVEEEPEPEPIFNDGILNDFQQSLLLLEKRVKEGPGSLSSIEVQDLIAMLNRIVIDMKDYDASGGSVPGIAGAPPATPTPPAVISSAPSTLDPPYVHEHNPEEGAAYDGKGGLGLAKGTANTYLIDGMDEMTPEEYRKALQESISGRQDKRKSSGMVGNMMSNNYLDNLNRGA